MSNFTRTAAVLVFFILVLFGFASTTRAQEEGLTITSVRQTGNSLTFRVECGYGWNFLIDGETAPIKRVSQRAGICTVVTHPVAATADNQPYTLCAVVANREEGCMPFHVYGTDYVPACSGGSNLPLQHNMDIRVTFDPPLNNVLRAQPSKSAERLASMPPGTEGTILGGPVCSNGLRYWMGVFDLEDGSAVLGWTADGQGSEHWLEPLP